MEYFGKINFQISRFFQIHGGLDNVEYSIYVKDFMDEEEEEEYYNSSKDRKSFEDKKNNFDIKRIMSEFIIKKEHFISYNKTDIKGSYTLSGWFIYT